MTITIILILFTGQMLFKNIAHNIDQKVCLTTWFTDIIEQ